MHCDGNDCQRPQSTILYAMDVDGEWRIVHPNSAGYSPLFTLKVTGVGFREARRPVTLLKEVFLSQVTG
jgi:hypothetical protein